MAKAKAQTGTGQDETTLQTLFYGGIQRDDKSLVAGGGSNVEELDILENANFVRPTQILTADTLPSNTAFHSYCEDPLNGDGYAVGGDNNGNAYAQVFQNTGIATTSPGGWVSRGTSSLPANPLSASTVHYEVESGATSIIPTLAVYFLTGQNVVTKWTASGGIATTGWTLSTLTTSMGHVSFREINGITYICAGNYVSTIDPGSPSTGANFNEQGFPLPFGYVAIDIAQAGEYFFVLASSSNLLANKSVIFIWDGVSQQYTDQIPVPMGGPQWIYNFKQTLTLCCASNGIMELFYLSAPTIGAICHRYPNIRLENVQLENQGLSGYGANQGHGYGPYIIPISPSKSVFVKDDVLYFALWKLDKTAIYAFGQLDVKMPFALWLAKRFSTADYSAMVPFATYCFGAKIFASFQTGYSTEGNAATNATFCDPATASRSSNAVFQSVWLDDNMPMNPKVLRKLYATAYPMPASCSITMAVSSDYSTSFTNVYQNSNIVMNILNAIFAIFSSTGTTNKKLFQWRASFTSRATIATTLSAAITTPNQTSISVTSGTGITNGDIVQVDQEQMTVTAGGGTTSLTVTRGTNGTIRTAHLNGANFYDLSVCPILTAVGMRKTIKALDA